MSLGRRLERLERGGGDPNRRTWPWWFFDAIADGKLPAGTEIPPSLAADITRAVAEANEPDPIEELLRRAADGAGGNTREMARGEQEK